VALPTPSDRKQSLEESRFETLFTAENLLCPERCNPDLAALLLRHPGPFKTS